MRNAYLETLYDLANNDKNIFAIISDNGAIVYDQYRKQFPEQYINAGISEANMVAMAAGMASRGKIPFAYTIGAFLAYRAYEFILNDVCLQNQNVKLVGIGAGCSYSLLGPSHHTIYDLAVLRPLPNLTIFSPASPLEVKKVVKAAYDIQGPVYIRLGTNREEEIYNRDYDFCVGEEVQLIRGTDLTIMATGSIVADVLLAARKLINIGYSIGVVNIHTISPFNSEAVIRVANDSKNILVVEEHSVYGGIGSAVAEVIASKKLSVGFYNMGLTDFVKGYGKHAEVKAENKLGVEDIIKKIKSVINKV